MTPNAADLRDRPAELLRNLVRFETVNPPGNERECVAWIQDVLDQAGLETRIVAKDPERPNLIARLPGKGEAHPLLLQGHTDVVPVTDQEWTKPPFDAEEQDGFIWGRGTLDMKGGVAMMIAAVLRALEQNLEPRGDVIFCALSDEEAGGDCGAQFLTEERPELFKGVRYALGEFGGFTIHIAGKRFSPVSVGEKQVCWLRGHVHGPGGHASLPMRGGTMGRLGNVLTRMDKGRLPVHVTPIVERFVKTLADGLGLPLGPPLRALLVPPLADRLLDVLGDRAVLFDPILHNTVNATIVHGGDKVNVVPGAVELRFDARVLPGFDAEDVKREIQDLAGDDLKLEVERFDETASEEPDLGLWDTLETVLTEADPGITPLPYLMPAVTDGRHFARLGIQNYGFTPMRLSEDFEFHSIIHAADERIPVEAVEFGTEAIRRVLERF